MGGSNVAQSADFQGTERFEVLTRLGQGGMGSVYQVVDRQRHARVALKSVGRVTGDALLRFKREFRALQELHHPNVVELGELFEKDGEWFFTMELVAGTDFFQYTRPTERDGGAGGGGNATGGSDPAEAPALAVTEIDPTLEDAPSRLVAHPLARAEIGFDEVRLRRALGQLTEALHAVHRHGQIHRDIKPGNVLVADDGRVVLIDFGLIAGVRDYAMSGEHHVVGTLAYMSPEQAAGHAVGAESDWYSVGVMLYEVLTGTKPHAGKGLQLLLRKQSELPRPPRECLRGIPADLDALCMDLLAIDPAERPTDREILRRLHVDVQRARGPSSQSAERVEDFIGRQPELTALGEELRRVLAGQPAIVTLAGRSGLGKTALLRHFAEQITHEHPDALVLQGRCYEQETVPYKALDAVMDQLSQWLKRQPESRAQALLPDDVALLERAFPVLQRVPAIAKARRDLADVRDPQQLRIRVMRTLRALFTTLASRLPVVIIIDDFQWSDEDSRRMIDELTGPPDPPPLLLVFAARAEDQVRAQGRTVRLEPLSEEQSIELALQMSRHLGEVERTRVEAVARQAEGYPFFVEALLYQPGAAELDDKLDLDEVIRGAINGVARVARRLLEVICAAGSPIAQSVAAAAAGISPAELGPQLNTLRRWKLVRTTGLRATDRVEPYHDRIRLSVIGNIDEGSRARLHGQLGAALEAHGAEPEQIAYHFRCAHDGPRATSYLIVAAERAMRALAFGRAADLYAEAEGLGTLTAEELREVRVERGRALASAGHGQRAAQAFTLAIDGSTLAEAIDLKRRIAEQLLIAGWHEEGLAACNAFLDDLGIDYPKSPRRALFAVAGLEIFLRVRGLGFSIDESPERSTEAFPRIDAYWSMAKGLAAHDPMRAQLFQTRGLLAALAAGEPSRIARSLAVHALSIGFLDPTARPRADAVLQKARELADRHANVFAQAQCKMVEALLDYVIHCRFTIDVAPAEQLLRSKCEDVAWELDLLSISDKQCLYWRGEWKRLAVAVHEQIKEADERGDRYLGVQIRSHWSSFLAALEGDFPRAHAEADYALGPTPSPVEALLNLLSNARVDLCEGQGEVALGRVESYEPGLMGSLALRATIFRTMFETTRLGATLATARQREGAQGRALFAQADKLARKLVRPGVDCTAPLAALARAAVAASRDETTTALERLVEAEAGFERLAMLAHRAVAQRRRGQLLGGDSGGPLIAQAESWLAAQGVRDFVAISRLLGPGFPAEE